MNIGNPDEFTLLELAEIIKELTGSTAEIIYEALPEDDPKQRKPNITLARELLGWSPEVSLRDGLAAHDRAVGRRAAGRWRRELSSPARRCRRMVAQARCSGLAVRPRNRSICEAAVL